MDSHDTCSICCEVYGEKLRPRVLSCGHNYCTDCLQKLIKNKETLSCPTYLKIHRVSSASEISVNFALEETLSKFAELKRSMTSKGREMENFIDELKSNCREQQVLTANMIIELLEYDQFLCNFPRKREELASDMQSLATRYECKSSEMKEERMKIAQVLEEVDAFDKELEGNLKSLETPVNSSADASSAVSKVILNVEALKDWIKNCQHQFPNSEFSSIKKDQEEAPALLADMDSTMRDNVEECQGSSETHVTILEKVMWNLNGTIVCENIGDKLRKRLWKQLVALGKVIAIDSRDGIQRCANLSLKEDKVYLHCLQKTDDFPASTLRVKHSELLSSLNKEETLAFMDLRWDDSLKGRILILLSPDTPLARNFRILCTGELGHTYAKSEFSHCARSRSNPNNRIIVGGNYERESGGLGKAVVQGINFSDAAYKRNREIGLVWAYSNSNDGASRFAIITYSDGRGVRDQAFGKLQDGIEVVKNAYGRLNTKKTVEIADCGVVLTL